MGQRVTAVQFSRIIAAKHQRILSRGREITQDYGEYGAELVRDVVETSGTAKTGKRGRIETGAMLEGVDSDYHDTSDGGEATWGFVRPTPYTKYQELGTQFIEPMLAVDDAFPNVDTDYKRALDNMLKEEWGN